MAQPRKLHDEYFKKAKAEGYLARSAYKLLEIQDRHRLIRRGDSVLDLGCAPGSWLQVAEKLVGPGGRVVGIDLTEVTHPFTRVVTTVQMDAFAAKAEELRALNDGRAFHVVLSDMAPNTSGHGDDLLSVRLCRRVLELLPGVLRVGGHCTMKVLEGGEFPELLNEVRSLFRDVKGLKPKASRDVSREIFIIAHGYKGAVLRGEHAVPGVVKGPPKPREGW